MSKKISLTKQQIESLYKTRNLEETATLLGVSVVTLRKCMKEVGVIPHSIGWREDTAIDKSLLVELYQKHPATDIAAILRVNLKTVYARLREHGIPVRASGGERKFDPTPEELSDLYSKRKLSITEIADHYGVGQSLIVRRLAEAGMTQKQIKLERQRRERIEKKNKNSYSAKTWRRAVMQRDGFKCVKCGLKSGDCGHCGQRIALHAHHVRPVTTHPELRFDVANGMTLCRLCHAKEHRRSIG